MKFVELKANALQRFTFVNYHGETVVAIPGATKASQAESNGLAMSINLSQSDLNSIADISEQFIRDITL